MFFSKKNSVAQMPQQQTNSIDENTKKALEQHQITFFRDYIRKGKKGSLSSVKFRVKIDLDGMAEIDGSPLMETIHTCMWDSFLEVLGKIVNEFCSEYANESYSPHLESVDILEIYHAEMHFDNLSMQDCHLHRFHRQYVVPANLSR